MCPPEDTVEVEKLLKEFKEFEEFERKWGEFSEDTEKLKLLQNFLFPTSLQGEGILSTNPQGEGILSTKKYIDSKNKDPISKFYEMMPDELKNQGKESFVRYKAAKELLQKLANIFSSKDYRENPKTQEIGKVSGLLFDIAMYCPRDNNESIKFTSFLQETYREILTEHTVTPVANQMDLLGKFKNLKMIINGEKWNENIQNKFKDIVLTAVRASKDGAVTYFDVSLSPGSDNGHSFAAHSYKYTLKENNQNQDLGTLNIATQDKSQISLCTTMDDQLLESVLSDMIDKMNEKSGINDYITLASRIKIDKTSGADDKYISTLLKVTFAKAAAEALKKSDNADNSEQLKNLQSNYQLLKKKGHVFPEYDWDNLAESAAQFLITAKNEQSAGRFTVTEGNSSNSENLFISPALN